MRAANLFPSRYLKAADLENDLTVTVKSLVTETLDQENKWVLYFAETEKGLVLNKTNANTIAKLHGEDVSNWKAKTIILFATEVDFRGELTLAIRIRLRVSSTIGGEGNSDPDDRGDDEKEVAF